MTDTAAGKVPVFACVRQAWQFLVANWRLFVPAAAILAVVSQIGPAFAVTLVLAHRLGRPIGDDPVSQRYLEHGRRVVG